MEKIAFLSALKEFDRRRQRSGWLQFALFSVLLSLVFVLVPAGLRHVPRAVIGSIAARQLILILSLTTVFVGYTAYAALSKRRLLEKLSLRCPHCAKVFCDQDLGRMGYTDTCSACGSAVFNGNGATQSSCSTTLESAPSGTSLRLRTRGEMFGLAQDFRKRDGYKIDKITIILGAGILMPLSFVLLIPVGTSGDIIGITLRSLAILVSLTGVFVLAHFARKRAARRFGLACPSCQHIFKPREFKYLGYSGQCEQCKAQLVR